MNPIRLVVGLLLGGAVVTGCERNLTAPSAEALTLSPAGFIGDRPYTWSLKCGGDFASFASWSWTADGVTVTGTEMSVFCSSTLTGSGTRPTVANGFKACVNASCQSWTFDPSRSFRTNVKGSNSQLAPGCDPFGQLNQKCLLTATATLTVDS